MFSLRDATAVDGRRVAEIRTASWQTAYRGIVPQVHLDVLDLESEAARWSAILDGLEPAHESMQLIVRGGLSDLGEVGGYVGAHPFGPTEPSWGEIMACYLHPDWWGIGAGDPLLAAGEQRLVGQGFVVGVLWVFEANGRARRFYERNGWTADGERDRNTSRFGDAAPPELRYTKTLSSADVSSTDVSSAAR